MNSVKSHSQTTSRPAPRPNRLRRWLGRGLLGLLLILILLVVAGALYQSVATIRDARNFPPPGRMVDVGGYQMHIHCTGERQPGTPAVILAASHPATVSSWVWIQPQVASVTQVCAYDSAGSGWSEPAPGPYTMGQMAQELRTLLDRAGIPGPIILVGHSFGGAVTRLFASQYRPEIAGLVWIEATHPDAWVRRGLAESTFGGMPPQQIAFIPSLARLGLFRLFPALRGNWGQIPGLPAQQQAELTAYFNTAKWADYVVAVEEDLPASLAALRDAGSLGDIPLVVVIGGASEETTGTSFELQQELAALSSNSAVLWVEGADHSTLVHEQRYALETGAAIRQVIEAVRMEQSLR